MKTDNTQTGKNMDLYSVKSKSIPQKAVIIFFEILLIILAYWILFVNGGTIIFEKSVRQDNFTKASIVTEKLIYQFGEKSRCLVISKSFSQLFIDASVRLKTLIPIELNIEAKKLPKKSFL